MKTAALLATKLYVPGLPRELVSRPRLIEQLRAGLDRKLTLVSAPAGYGKTTLLSEGLGAILFGKIAVAVGFAWIATLIVLLVGLAIVNIVHWTGHIGWYTPAAAAGSIVIGLLMALLGAAAGILTSLRSATVQEAQQIMMASIMVPPLVLGVIATAVLASQPEWFESVQRLAGRAAS